jgi:hypothetical protein
MSTIDWAKHTLQSLNFTLKDERMYARFDADKSDISFDAWIRLVSIGFDLPFMHNHLPGSDYCGKLPTSLVLWKIKLTGVNRTHAGRFGK